MFSPKSPQSSQRRQLLTRSCSASVFALLLVLSFASPATAVECFSPSTLSQPSGDPYAALDVTRLSTAKRKAVLKLFKSLRGHWSGKTKGYFCKGTEASPRRVADNAELSIKFEFDSRDTLVMDATVTNRKRGVTRNERLKLVLGKHTLRVNRDSAAGDSHVLSATGSRLGFATKDQFARGGGIGINEVHRMVKMSGSQLSINFLVYSQGGLSATSRWTASKR